MPFDHFLDKPIDRLNPEIAPVLADLQANILIGHGRDHTCNLLLRFDPARQSANRTRLAQLAGFVTSAEQALSDRARLKNGGEGGGPVILFAMSAGGYAALNLPAPADLAFRQGMAARSGILSDPDSQDFQDHLRDPDALLLVAADDAATAKAVADNLLTQLLGDGISLLGIDEGLALRRPAPAGSAKGPAIEHFGYADGISQPLLLADQLAAEPQAAWDPAFSPLKLALVRDFNAATDAGFGSYLVYRKLEQDVAKFKQSEEQLADVLGLMGTGRDLAGALAVGRFEDGTPVALPAGQPGGLVNDFTYAADADGLGCPFHAHVRKTNPRGDTARRLGANEADERLHLMPRRGITYGTRADLPELNGPFPSNGVGLLFMAYNSDIRRQFEFTQASWSNNPAFVDDAAAGVPNTGVDPVTSPAALLDPAGVQTWRETPAAEPKAFAFGGAVTLMGGDYFFAPAISSIARL
jgi:deferrochelatase/peroxidase EfeB